MAFSSLSPRPAFASLRKRFENATRHLPSDHRSVPVGARPAGDIFSRCAFILRPGFRHCSSALPLSPQRHVRPGVVGCRSPERFRREAKVNQPPKSWTVSLRAEGLEAVTYRTQAVEFELDAVVIVIVDVVVEAAFEFLNVSEVVPIEVLRF